MKSFLLTIGGLTLLAAIVSLFAFFSGQPSNKPADMSGTDTVQSGKMVLTVAKVEEGSIRYTEFDGDPVELSISDKGLILRVFTGNWSSASHNDSILIYLTREVERLTTGKEVQLGGSGYTFQLTNGIPIWGPHATSMGAHNNYQCLEFAENAKINGKLITAVGRPDPVRPEEYYPYKLNPK